MIDLLHQSKKWLNIFWQYKNVELGPFYNFKYSENFHWLCTYWSKIVCGVTKISAELWLRSNIWWYFSRPCNVFLCGSGRCSKSDFPSNWVRQRAQRTLHGQFPGPAAPTAQTCLLHQTTFQSQQHANSAFSYFTHWNWRHRKIGGKVDIQYIYTCSYSYDYCEKENKHWVEF